MSKPKNDLAELDKATERHKKRGHCPWCGATTSKKQPFCSPDHERKQEALRARLVSGGKW